MNRLLGWLGLLAAVGVGTGEFLLHYSNKGYSSIEPYQFFISIGDQRVVYGHFISVLFAPLYIPGYYFLYQTLDGGSTLLRKIFLSAGIYGLSVGSVWIGSRSYLHGLVNFNQVNGFSESSQSLMLRFSFLNETLLSVTRASILLASLAFVFLVASGKTKFSRWIALINPIFLVLSCFGVYLVYPLIGSYIMPIAMNVAHLILFSTILIYTRQTKGVL